MSQRKIWCCTKKSFAAKKKFDVAQKLIWCQQKQVDIAGKSVSCQQKKLMLHKKSISCRQKHDDAVQKSYFVLKKGYHFFLERLAIFLYRSSLSIAKLNTI